MAPAIRPTTSSAVRARADRSIEAKNCMLIGFLVHPDTRELIAIGF